METIKNFQSIEDCLAYIEYLENVNQQLSQKLDAKSQEITIKDKEIEYLKKQLKLREEFIIAQKYRLYGKKSEKWSEKDYQYSLLFNEIEDTIEESKKEFLEFTEVSSYKRKKKKQRKIKDLDIPVREIIHDPEENQVCNCGNKREEIGRETKDVLQVIPLEFYIDRHITIKRVCKKCSQNQKVEIVSGEPIKQFLPKSYASESLLAFLLVSKFNDGLPFYRMEKIFERYGIEIPRNTMCIWAQKTGIKLRRFYRLLVKEALKSSCIGIDETGLKVLENQRSSGSRNSYMWVMRTLSSENPMVIFYYRKSRSADFLKKVLKDYKNAVITDGFKSYESHLKELNITHAGCWAHARRNFIEAKKVSSRPDIEKMLYLIGKLYTIEEEIKTLSLEEKVSIRQDRSKKIIDEIHKLLKDQLPLQNRFTQSGKAYYYLFHQWEKLIRFLDNPSIPLDNNLVENAIRPFVIGRKNWLFSGTELGAQTSAILYTIIESAKLNQLDPYHYIKYLFEQLIDKKSDEELLKLLPHKIDKKEIENSFVKPG
ncbi:MAG: transposase [Candidatus Woesearchaeota archaeon]|nr:MAG: transposase [Candidatus Woesearchaeota archaeon]GIX40445.1 MAG: transposase [Leptospiraceae bacterium]